MMTESEFREYVHKIVDEADIVKLKAILNLIGEDYLSPEEVAEIKSLSESDDWVNWRQVRDDV